MSFLERRTRAEALALVPRDISSAYDDFMPKEILVEEEGWMNADFCYELRGSDCRVTRGSERGEA